MTDAMDHNEDRELAAEYALGLLEPDEARAFEARLAADPALRAEYVVWAEQFASLTDALPETQPPAATLQAIQTRLFPEENRSIWQRLSIMQAVLGTAAAALVVVLVMQFGGPDAPPEGPLYVAELGAEDGSLTVIAALATGAEALELTRTGPRAPDGHSYELWLIVGEDAPVSLGVLPSEQRGLLDIHPDHRAQLPGATLAVSVEPFGGSPTGAPTGDVVAVGAVSEV